MKKKFFQNISLFVVLVCIISLLTGLGACTAKKPWDYENVEWYSDTPNIKFVKDENTYWQGTILVNDEVFQIEMLWGPTGSFEIVDSTKDDGLTAVEDMTLLRGRVKFDDTKAVLIIKDDNVFNGKYEKITLLHRDI